MEDKEITWEEFYSLMQKEPDELTSAEADRLEEGMNKWRSDPAWEFKEKYKDVDQLSFNVDSNCASVIANLDVTK